MSEEKKSNGFVALYRSVRDDWMFPTSEERFTRFEAFCDLLMMAQGKPEGRRIKRGSRTIELARGEAAINLTRLGERWGRGRKWVRNFIKTGEQAKTWVQRKPDGVPNGTTIISFVNYDTYNPLRSWQDPTETPTQGQQKTQRGHNEGTTRAQRGADQQGNKETKEQGKKGTSAGAPAIQPDLTLEQQEVAAAVCNVCGAQGEHATTHIAEVVRIWFDTFPAVNILPAVERVVQRSIQSGRSLEWEADRFHGYKKAAQYIAGALRSMQEESAKPPPTRAHVRDHEPEITDEQIAELHAGGYCDAKGYLK